jgi:hypothetical protein
MPTLNITKLECIKKRDPIGKSEFDFYVSVDSGSEAFLSGPYLMDNSKNDDEVVLSDTKPFTEKIRLRVKERDGARGGNNDLDLGTLDVYADERLNTTYRRSFRSSNGGVVVDVSYKLT